MMSLVTTCAARWLALTAVGAALVVLAKAVKYRDFTEESALGLDDLGWVALVELGVVLAALGGPVGHVLGTLVGTLVFAALWLDAVLFRIFTIELGPGGVGSVILSVLYRELAELTFARRFFSAHRLFATLPLAALLAHAGVPLAPPGASQWGLAAGLGSWLTLTAFTSGAGRARRQVLAASVGLVAVTLAEGAAPALTLPLVAVPLGLLGMGRVVSSHRDAAPDGVRHFFVERPRPEPADFQPRAEHAPLFTRSPQPPRPSAAHGLLRGRDVLLLTFESVGRLHLAAFTPGGARAPFLESCLSQALHSRHHACVSPTTNNAHLAIYTSGYGTQPSANVRALREAGYRTVYLSTARTGDYGLRAILDAAGFQHIIDRAVLREPPGGGAPTDQVLLTEGLDRLEEVLRGQGPFFLHVHATNTHVPYRVAEPERFHHFDMAEDRGRFLNGVEECDALFGALTRGLKERGLTHEPLVVVSSDHGQAFGGLGYQSHGSAVTREELDVPLVMHHPLLPAREVAFSSHFDVLPTVLDLVGVGHGEPVFGDSLLHEDRSPELLVWAGHPSRRTTSNYGLLLEGEKRMVDLALGRCLRMDWRDEHVELLEGAEKEYTQALVSRLMSLRGVT